MTAHDPPILGPDNLARLRVDGADAAGVVLGDRPEVRLPARPLARLRHLVDVVVREQRGLGVEILGDQRLDE
jgi:hypothetical protein